MRPRSVLPALFLTLILSPAGANESAAYQFEHNAKLAGRTLACGDRAGHAAMRSVSRELAERLDGGDAERHMRQFDERAERQRRFAAGKNVQGSTCRRISEELRENLDRSTYLLEPLQVGS